MILELKAPAKLNLFLKITGKRADGYHELESLFAKIDLCDVIKIRVAERFKITASGEFAHELPDAENNLITRVIDFFAREFETSPNLEIELTKNIPTGAGLGGGSSDAAAVMKALNQMFELGLKKSELQRIALNFGSDLGFFFEENPLAIVRGTGEIFEPTSISPLQAPILLAKPRASLSTLQVYKNFKRGFSKSVTTSEINKTPLLELVKNFPNDLSEPSIELLPEVSKILELLNEQYGCKAAKMSGSGSCCFAIFSDKSELDLAYQKLSSQKLWLKQTEIHFNNLCLSSPS